MPELVRIALAVLAAAGCTPGGSSGGVPTTQAPPERLALGLRDDGRTVQVHTETRLTLTLPERYRWSLPVSEGVPIVVSEVLSDEPTGAQTWELRPTERGRALLTTTGSPACRPATPNCPTAPRTYAVTLDVR